MKWSRIFQKRRYNMDKRYFDLIDVSEACAVHANILARNANDSNLVEDFTTPQLNRLLTEMSRCLHNLNDVVYSQVDYASRYRDIDIRK